MTIFEYLENYINKYKDRLVEQGVIVEFNLNKDSVKEEKDRLYFSYKLKILPNNQKLQSIKEGMPLHRLRLFLQSNLEGKVVLYGYKAEVDGKYRNVNLSFYDILKKDIDFKNFDENKFRNLNAVTNVSLGFMNGILSNSYDIDMIPTRRLELHTTDVDINKVKNLDYLNVFFGKVNIENVYIKNVQLSMITNTKNLNFKADNVSLDIIESENIIIECKNLILGKLNKFSYIDIKADNITYTENFYSSLNENINNNAVGTINGVDIKKINEQGLKNSNFKNPVIVTDLKDTTLNYIHGIIRDSTNVYLKPLKFLRIQDCNDINVSVENNIEYITITNSTVNIKGNKKSIKLIKLESTNFSTFTELNVDTFIARDNIEILTGDINLLENNSDKEILIKNINANINNIKGNIKFNNGIINGKNINDIQGDKMDYNFDNLEKELEKYYNEEDDYSDNNYDEDDIDNEYTDEIVDEEEDDDYSFDDDTDNEESYSFDEDIDEYTDDIDDDENIDLDLNTDDNEEKQKEIEELKNKIQKEKNKKINNLKKLQFNELDNYENIEFSDIKGEDDIFDIDTNGDFVDKEKEDKLRERLNNKNVKKLFNTEKKPVKEKPVKEKPVKEKVKDNDTKNIRQKIVDKLTKTIKEKDIKKPKIKEKDIKNIKRPGRIADIKERVNKTPKKPSKQIKEIVEKIAKKPTKIKPTTKKVKDKKVFMADITDFIESTKDKALSVFLELKPLFDIEEKRYNVLYYTSKETILDKFDNNKLYKYSDIKSVHKKDILTDNLVKLIAKHDKLGAIWKRFGEDKEFSVSTRKKAVIIRIESTKSKYNIFILSVLKSNIKKFKL